MIQAVRGTYDLLPGDIESRMSRLCEDCQRRGERNPLRVFDCKVPSCQPVLAELPTIAEHLCDGCRDHFVKLQSYLSARGIKFRLKPRLVRGFEEELKTGTLQLRDTGTKEQRNIREEELFANV